jgi:hypothetical protein
VTGPADAGDLVDLARVRASLARLDALSADTALTSPEAQARLAGDLPALLDGADPMPKKTETVTLRLPEGTRAKADALIPILEARPTMRAVNVTRSTLLLEALLRGLDAIEAEGQRGAK